MRVGLGLAAGLAVLALGDGTSSWSAPPPQTTMVTAAPAPVSTARVAPGSTVLRSGPLRAIVLLTTQECGQLGGAVTSEDTRLCHSGSVCIRADQDGAVHRVCISEAK